MKQVQCVCSDRGCPQCSGLCEEQGTVRLWRVDMYDHCGASYCAGCAEDALSSGVFGTEEAVGEDGEDGEDGGFPVEPEDGDYIMSPCGRLGSRTYVAVVGGKGLGEFASDEEAEEAIRVECVNSQWWPNVWSMSDHGNMTLRTIRAEASR